MNDAQLAFPLDAAPGVEHDSLPRLGLPPFVDEPVPFDDDDFFFEPWWPGARALVRRVGGRLEVITEHLSDALTAFPELHELDEQLDAGDVVLEGTLLALDSEGRPDAQLLARRLGWAGGQGSGVREVEAEAAFVASDLPYLEGRSLVTRPFSERRRALARAVRDGERMVLARGLLGDGVTLAQAVTPMGLEAIAARRLRARWRQTPGRRDRVRLPVLGTPARPPRPFLVLLSRLPLDD